MKLQKENTTIEIAGCWEANITKRYNEYVASGTEYFSKEDKKSIYKWPNDLVVASSNDWYRTPHMASIGPYHHGKEHLKPMEHHKERALYRILQRSKVPLSRFVSSLKEVEQELKSNYDYLDPKLSSDSFLRMMLLDGCFILELLRPIPDQTQGGKQDDSFFWEHGMLTITVIHRDMLMLENQIPLLVLKRLLGVETGRELEDDNELIRLIINVYNFEHPPKGGPNLHILDVYRKYLLVDNEEKGHTTSWSPYLNGLHFLSMVPKYMIIAIAILVYKLLGGRIPKPGYVRSAMRLHEGGIEFKKNKPDQGLNITFDEKRGVLTLPYITIEDHTAVIYMNMMAFERMHPQLWDHQHVTWFVAFMDRLIDTAEDVNLLSSRAIVSNHLGSDEDAAKVFNKLGDGIVYTPNEKLLRDLQSYVASGWNAAKAYLEHNYFKNPWSVVSLLAAIVLLVLTFIQTLASLKG